MICWLRQVGNPQKSALCETPMISVLFKKANLTIKENYGIWDQKKKEMYCLLKSIWMVPISLPPTQAPSLLWQHSPLRPQWPLDSNSREGGGLGDPGLEAAHITSTHFPKAKTQWLSHNHLPGSLGNSMCPRGRGSRLGRYFNYMGGGGRGKSLSLTIIEFLPNWQHRYCSLISLDSKKEMGHFSHTRIFGIWLIFATCYCLYFVIYQPWIAPVSSLLWGLKNSVHLHCLPPSLPALLVKFCWLCCYICFFYDLKYDK